MNLHEYQAKRIFGDYGLPVAKGKVITDRSQAEQAARELGGAKWVAKAQVHAGGRGKAGGVLVTDRPAAIAAFAKKMLGTRLVTKQTDAQGQPIDQILVEECTAIARELYLSVLIDRQQERLVVLASPAGGMDIEAVASETPEQIHRVAIDPLLGPQPFQARELALPCGLNPEQTRQFTDLFLNLVRLFMERDAALVEINPLVITTTGDLLCLDAKINLDDNALYRQSKLRALRDPRQEDARENRAAQHGLSYVALDGNIGCMVNGAGLAMATMDIIKTCGGMPANFLDVGGSATQERVSEAFKIILADSKVKAVLVNIFGGIVRCDLIAAGIIHAIAEVGVKVPVVVRLEGNRAAAGMEALRQSALKVIAPEGLAAAAEAAVTAARTN